MNLIKVSRDNWGFVDGVTGERFVPMGANYAGTIRKFMEGDVLRTVSTLYGVDDSTAADGVAEARRAFKAMGDAGFNLVRVWLEPNDFFPVGEALSPRAIARFNAVLDAAEANGIRITVGMHLGTIYSGLPIHQDLFQPPHNRRQQEQLYALAAQWGRDPRIFSWTIVGEGSLPWETEWMRRQWPQWLEYWYRCDLKQLREAWGREAFSTQYMIQKFEDAPIPPKPVGLQMSLEEFGKRLGAGTLPADPWAGSNWRYDWRLFMEELGARRVREEVRALRAGGAQQMIAVGNNCWFHPCLPAGWMGNGYHPYFFLESVDYVCQHNYAFFQCMPGHIGDPLSSQAAMDYWLASMEIMSRFYAAMGKPVVLEEFGWHSGCRPTLPCSIARRTEKEQADFMNRQMEVTRHCASGWLNWPWRDMPTPPGVPDDITSGSGLFAADGKRLKPWGKAFAGWAETFRREPPRLQKGRKTVRVNMKDVMTGDLAVDRFFKQTAAAMKTQGPFDFEPVYEPRPMAVAPTDLREKKRSRS